GQVRMQHWIDSVGYGNQVIGDSIDWFWLDGPLMIRPYEQVYFIKDLVNEALPFDKAVQRQVKDIALVEATPDYRLHAKTGLTRANPDHIGWYVGWVEHAAGIHAFALNAQVPSLEQRTLRQAITHAILQHENIIPTP
ncbi:MAG: penicillin-binding transpeptidase domain-containing protein, partial [Bacteroidota bacterium]